MFFFVIMKHVLKIWKGNSEFFCSSTALVSLSLLIFEVLRSNAVTPHSVRIFRMSDQADAVTSTCHHTTLKRENIYAPGWVRTRNPSKRVTASPHFRPRSHWDRLSIKLPLYLNR